MFLSVTNFLVGVVATPACMPPPRSTKPSQCYIFVCFLHSEINLLAQICERSVPIGNVLYLNSQRLVAAHNASHFVNLVGIQYKQWHSLCYSTVQEPGQSTNPSWFLPSVLSVGMKCYGLNSSTCLPLKNQNRVQQLSTGCNCHSQCCLFRVHC